MSIKYIAEKNSDIIAEIGILMSDHLEQLEKDGMAENDIKISALTISTHLIAIAFACAFEDLDEDDWRKLFKSLNQQVRKETVHLQKEIDAMDVVHRYLDGVKKS